MPRVKVVHGHWGEVYIGSTLVAEATSIEYTLSIERIEVPQSGVRWTTFHEGLISGEGELRLHKVYSDFEGAFLPYLTLTPDQLRAVRDAGGNARPATTIKVTLDDPHAYGRESETLTDVLFWQYTGGYDITALTGRNWPFSFEGIIVPQQRVPRNNSLAIY